MRNGGGNGSGSGENGNGREERGVPKEAVNLKPRCLRRAPISCRRNKANWVFGARSSFVRPTPR